MPTIILSANIYALLICRYRPKRPILIELSRYW